jgi:small subunit ribosomal protein S18
MRKSEDRGDFKSDKGERFGGGDRGDRGGRDGGAGGEKRSFQRRKGCRFCGDGALTIDYKDKHILAPFITERYKIVPRRISGTCASHQRHLTTAIKRARHIAIISYTTAQV